MTKTIEWNQFSESFTTKEKIHKTVWGLVHGETVHIDKESYNLLRDALVSRSIFATKDSIDEDTISVRVNRSGELVYPDDFCGNVQENMDFCMEWIEQGNIVVTLDEVFAKMLVARRSDFLSTTMFPEQSHLYPPHYIIMLHPQLKESTNGSLH